MPLAVALADDNLIVRAGVTQILATETDMAVVS
jgi:DNA-binding NarL/FixJ family response regulator